MSYDESPTMGKRGVPIDKIESLASQDNILIFTDSQSKFEK